MNKKIILPLLLTMMTTTSNIGIMKEETIIGADFSSGIYSYELLEKFYESPNTIEAWVRLPKLAKNEPGGVIFGNFETYNTSSVKLEVNKNRQICLMWNAGEANVIFDKYTLAIDDWEHISVTRDDVNDKFTLYVNGKFIQEVKVYSGKDSLSDFRYIVGGDWSNWSVAKNIFRGEISQVTAYSRALTSKEIYEDYTEGDKISYKTRDDLLFNGEFSFGSIQSNDTSRYANHARIRSNDYFYEGELFEARDYSFSVIPDPQIMTRWRRDIVPYLGNYLMDHQEKQKISLAICVGDNADGDGDWDDEFGAMKSVYDNIKEKIRWITTPGNHDYDDTCKTSRNLTWYNKYFNYNEISTYDYFGGAYKNGYTENAYYKFEECGVKYLVISIEFGADDDVLAWANEIVKQNQDCRVIVDTHGYVSGSGELLSAGMAHAPTAYGWSKEIQVNDADDIYNKFIRKHKNIFMVFSGHIPYDDIVYREDVGDNGNVIVSFLIDGQGVMYSGAEPLLSLFAFDELNQRVSINYINAKTNKFYNIQNQFTYSFKGHTDILSSVYYDEEGNLKPEYIDRKD